jgi:hypothetical protein
MQPIAQGRLHKKTYPAAHPQKLINPFQKEGFEGIYFIILFYIIKVMYVQF